MKINKTILAVVLLAAACGYVRAAEKNNKAALASLTMPDGSRVEAELALTPRAQAQGLMFREDLPENAGMLFVFNSDEVRTFWMKNTYITLDIVFLDANLKVRNVYHRVPRSAPDQPESEVAKVSAPARYVLELAAGKAKKCGLKPGSVIKASFPPVKKPKAAPKAAQSATAS
ncbi:MAG TPA: DUF192 domain-containing protein [Elusimicrobiales bacterium]|nr:DUF192 domain-containing protein [Elusimicrobiales bacterium]